VLLSYRPVDAGAGSDASPVLQTGASPGRRRRQMKLRGRDSNPDRSVQSRVGFQLPHLGMQVISALAQVDETAAGPPPGTSPVRWSGGAHPFECAVCMFRRSGRERGDELRVQSISIDEPFLQEFCYLCSRPFIWFVTSMRFQELAIGARRHW
jgi:hypothetical protein